jgi:hypothetical protein
VQLSVVEAVLVVEEVEEVEEVEWASSEQVPSVCVCRREGR